MGILNYAEGDENDKVQYIGNFTQGEPDGIGTIYWGNGNRCKTKWNIGNMVDNAKGKLFNFALIS